MTRTANTNYQAAANTQFVIATDDADAFDREDISKLATGVDLHDHDTGRGLPVKRVAPGIVGTAGLADGAVTLVKHGASSVDSTVLAADSVNASHIQAGAVGASEIVDGGVGTAELANGSVTLGKLASGTANRLFATDGAGVPSLLQLAAAMVPNGILTSAMITDGTIQNADLAGSIDGTKLSADTVTEDKIAITGTPFPNWIIGWTGSALIWFQANSLSIAASAVTNTILADSSVTIPKVVIAGTPIAGKTLGYDGSGFVWQTPASGVTLTGVVAAVQTAAAIPVGWTRETNLDGRMMVYDGTTFSTTWVENTAYGSSWSHLHGHSATHSHNMAAAGVSGNTGTEQGGTLYDEDETGGGHNARDGHTHNQGSLDVTGSSDPAAPGNTDNAAWVIPTRAYVAIKAT